MHFSKIAIAAAAAGVVSAQDMGDSICDKYTKALLKDNTGANQATLVTLIVKTAALGAFTGPGTQNADLPGSMVPVKGLLAEGDVDGTKVNLAPYFTGELASTNVNGKASSVNWLDSPADELMSNATSVGRPGTKTNQLISHLVSYFGAALGCSQYGMDGLPAYAGDNSQARVHQFMVLSHPEVTWFNMNVGLAASSFGASDEDVKAVGSLLDKTFNYRCLPPATVVPAGGNQTQSICQAEDCPLAENANCDLYPMEAEPATVSPMAGAMPTGVSMSGGAAVPTTAGSGSPPAVTGTPAVSGTPAPGASTSFTGGAAFATGAPMAAAAAAGLAALML